MESVFTIEFVASCMRSCLEKMNIGTKGAFTADQLEAIYSGTITLDAAAEAEHEEFRKQLDRMTKMSGEDMNFIIREGGKADGNDI